MPNKVKKGSFWIICCDARIYEIKRVDAKRNMLWAQGYSRQGTPNDHIEHAPIDEFLGIATPCPVVKSEYFDEEGNLMYHTVEYLEVK